MFRQALRLYLEKEADLQVVGETSESEELARLIREEAADLLCIDSSLLHQAGSTLVRQLLALRPSLRIVMMSASCEANLIVPLVRAGTLGVVSKRQAAAELLRAIRSARLGRLYLCPETAETVAGSALSPRGAANDPVPLGARERQVLQLIAEGYTSNEIARDLNVAQATIEVHRRNIMRKLGLHRVAELTRYAVRHGLTACYTERRK